MGFLKNVRRDYVRLQKHYPWDYVRFGKKYPWDCIAITKIVGDYKYFTFELQQDYTITVGLHLCGKDLSSADDLDRVSYDSP